MVSHSETPVAPIEKVKVVSEKVFEIRFTASKELLVKIERLKGLLAHRDPILKSAKMVKISKAQIKRLVWQRDRGT